MNLLLQRNLNILLMFEATVNRSGSVLTVKTTKYKVKLKNVKENSAPASFQLAKQHADLVAGVKNTLK